MTLLSNKSIKGIFFDLYGTLLDYNDMEKSNLIWLNQFYKLAGIPNGLSFDSIKEICKKILLEDHEKDHSDSLTTYESKIKFHFEQHGVVFSRERLKELADESLIHWQDNITLSEDVYDVFRKLQDKYKLALISNFDHTPHVKRVIKQLQLQNYLNPIIISDEIGFKKPDPEIFRLTLERAGLTADEVIFIGDSYNDDIKGARAAEIFPVMIQHISNSHSHNIIPDGTDLVTIQSLSELFDLLPNQE